MAENTVEELLTFLLPSSQPHARDQALNYICGLSGTPEGRKTFGTLMTKLSAALLTLADDSYTSKEAVLTGLVNFSGDELVARKFCEDSQTLKKFLQMVVDPTETYADPVCMILSNITRDKLTCHKVMDVLTSDQNDVSFAQLIEVFCKEGYNTKAKLHFLGPILANLTQLPEARRFLLDKERCVVQRLLPFIQYEASDVRRRAAITALKNCCFETEFHEWLLSDTVDILSHLLLPLAGPEELSEEDMEGMPDDLQYLEEGKQREADPEIRSMLVEAVMKLCSTKVGRQIVKDKRTYVIMREYHKWEKNPSVASVCEKLVQILISDEPEAGMEDLHKVDIPRDIVQQLEENTS